MMIMLKPKYRIKIHENKVARVIEASNVLS